MGIRGFNARIAEARGPTFGFRPTVDGHLTCREIESSVPWATVNEAGNRKPRAVATTATVVNFASVKI